MKLKLSLKKKGSQGKRRGNGARRPRGIVLGREQKPEMYALIGTCKFFGGAGPTV